MFFVTVNNVKNTWVPLSLAVRIAMGTAFESAGVEQLNISSLDLVGAGISRNRPIIRAKLFPFTS